MSPELELSAGPCTRAAARAGKRYVSLTWNLFPISQSLQVAAAEIGKCLGIRFVCSFSFSLLAGAFSEGGSGEQAEKAKEIEVKVVRILFLLLRFDIDIFR